jgi:hypothetical protein
MPISLFPVLYLGPNAMFQNRYLTSTREKGDRPSDAKKAVALEKACGEAEVDAIVGLEGT